jgi:hypothetical protein
MPPPPGGRGPELAKRLLKKGTRTSPAATHDSVDGSSLGASPLFQRTANRLLVGVGRSCSTGRLGCGSGPKDVVSGGRLAVEGG